MKCVTGVQSCDNIVATGGREGRIVIHDIRCADSTISTLGTVLSWKNVAVQQILSKKANPTSVSITGLASFGDQVIATDSHTDNLSFYDLRKPTSLLFVCSIDRDFHFNEKSEFRP